MHICYNGDLLLEYYRLMPTEISKAYYEMDKCVKELENTLINNPLFFEKNIGGIIELIKSSYWELKQPLEVIIGFYNELYEAYCEIAGVDS